MKVIFKDRDIIIEEFTYSDAKLARRKLRAKGLSVKNATKVAEGYIFQVGEVIVPALVSGSVERIIKRPLTEERNYCPIELPIRGKDLKPFDRIVEFVPQKNITLDSRGLQEIMIEAPTILEITRKYFGFYSVESKGALSFVINPDDYYLVLRPLEE